MDYFGSTNKGPPVYVASGNAARASRPRRGKRRKPTRKGRKRAPPKRTISEIYRRKHNKTHLRDIIREERAQYRPQTNDEFTNENLNADVVSNIESLNLNNESISGEKGKIGGRRRTRRRRKRGVPTSLSQKGGGDSGPEMHLYTCQQELAACREQLDGARQAIATQQAALDEKDREIEEVLETLQLADDALLRREQELRELRSAVAAAAGGAGGRGYVWRCPHCGDYEDAEVCQTCGSARPASTGGGRHTKKRRTRRRNRRRNSQRRTRRGGDSPLHIRRRLLALAARIKKWKNERKRHKDAKAKAEAEKKRSAFGAIPEGIN